MRIRETATRDIVPVLKKFFLWPMEWHEAMARHSSSLSASVWGRRRSWTLAVRSAAPRKPGPGAGGMTQEEGEPR